MAAGGDRGHWLGKRDRAALEAFHIYARKVPLEDGEYSMDHSAYVMLFDRDGRFDQVIAYQEDPERVLSKLRHALEAAR